MSTNRAFDKTPLKEMPKEVRAFLDLHRVPQSLVDTIARRGSFVEFKWMAWCDYAWAMTMKYHNGDKIGIEDAWQLEGYTGKCLKTVPYHEPEHLKEYLDRTCPPFDPFLGCIDPATHKRKVDDLDRLGEDENDNDGDRSKRSSNGQGEDRSGKDDSNDDDSDDGSSGGAGGIHLSKKVRRNNDAGSIPRELPHYLRVQ